MRRKILWLLGLLLVASATSHLIDHARARRWRALWAEATDHSEPPKAQ